MQMHHFKAPLWRCLLIKDIYHTGFLIIKKHFYLRYLRVSEHILNVLQKYCEAYVDILKVFFFPFVSKLLQFWAFAG